MMGYMDMFVYKSDLLRVRCCVLKPLGILPIVIVGTSTQVLNVALPKGIPPGTGALSGHLL